MENKFEKWLIHGGEFPKLDLPFVPYPSLHRPTLNSGWDESYGDSNEHDKDECDNCKIHGTDPETGI